MKHLSARWRALHKEADDGMVTDFLDSWEKLYDMQGEPRRPGWKYRDLNELVRKEGKTFVPGKPEDYPEDLPRGEMGECFMNALHAALDYGGMYCEGFSQGAFIPLAHAWVSLDGRTALDVTWEVGYGKDFHGIAFDPRWVQRVVSKSGYYGVFGEMNITEVAKWIKNGIPAEAKA